MTEFGALQFGPFRLLGRHGPLLRDLTEIRLQPRALAVLWTLARQAGEVVTKLALMDAAWPGTVVGEDALTFQVQALRRAMEDDPKAPQYILTAHRLGFRLALPPTAPASPRGAAGAAGTELFVGRQMELQALRSALERAQGGRRQTVFVTGEAGIGKTALVDAFMASLAGRGAWVARGQCIEHQGTAEPYLAVLDALGRLLRRAADDQPMRLLRRVAPSWLLQLPALMDPDDHARLRRQTAGVRNDAVLRELAEALEQLAALRPVLLVLEDLHWSDAATIDLLAMLGRRSEAAQLLVIGTYRPVDAIIGTHPVRALQLGLTAGQQASEIALGYLQPAAVGQYLVRRLGAGQVTPELARIVHGRSGGHPLFLARISDYLVGPEEERTSPIDTSELEAALPAGLRDLIALQLHQLTLTEQLVLEVASVVGVEFAAASVAAGVGIAVEAVEQHCARLVQQGQFLEEAGLAVWPDGSISGRFRFRHVLYRQVLLPMLAQARRARLHRQMADRLETAYGERAAEVAGELVNHYEQAGVLDKAVRYCIVMARTALERTAAREVALLTERGLSWLAALPAGAGRNAAELALRVLAARALQAEHGYHCAEALPHLAVIERLVPSEHDPVVLEPALAALWTSAHFRAQFDLALVHAARVGELGQLLDQPALACCGYAWSANSLHLMGRHADAETASLHALHLAARALERRPELVALEPACAAQTCLALTRWSLGFPDQALRAARDACAAAALIGNPYTESVMRSAALGTVLVSRREWAELRKASADAVLLSECYDHADALSWARQHQMIARGMLGPDPEALDQLQSIMAAERASGSCKSLILGFLGIAECALRAGRLDLARQNTDTALELIESRGIRAWEPDAWRMRAEVLLATDPATHAGEAEACLQRSLTISRGRQGRSLELRAALRLARLWLSGQRPDQALELIQPLYRRFSEGFETPDLIEAAQLIERLEPVAG